MKATVQLPATPQVGATAVPVDIAVQYLAGGAAGDLPVVAARADPRPRAAAKLDDFEHVTFANGPVKEGIVRSSESDEEEPSSTASPAVHSKRQTLTLDAAGTARATDRQPADRSTTLRELLAEVEYRDPNGEVQTAAATVPLWPAALLPGIEAEHWAGAKEQLTAKVAVVDTDAASRSPARRCRSTRFDAHALLASQAPGRRLLRLRARRGDRAASAVLCDGKTDAQGLLACSGAPPARRAS